MGGCGECAGFDGSVNGSVGAIGMCSEVGDSVVM